jgi:hypothetical protein
LNLRPREPEPRALAKLSYTPNDGFLRALAVSVNEGVVPYERSSETVSIPSGFAAKVTSGCLLPGHPDVLEVV